MAALRALRVEVFVHEQGVPEELELDSLDEGAIHAVAFQGRAVVGTGRLILRANGEAQVGRMAVTAALRRRGIGSAILRYLEEEARDRGVVRIVLHAQTYVSNFYRLRGYANEGEPFMEAGIEHIVMSKSLA
jgi:predicted GNAT family N-acyltransferase